MPALVGAGVLAQKRQDHPAALDYFRRALAGRPGEASLLRRVAELKLQITERRVAEAHAALEAGDPGTAEARYREALEAAPEVAGVRLELAELLESGGDPSAAADVLGRKAQGDGQTSPQHRGGECSLQPLRPL